MFYHSNEDLPVHVTDALPEHAQDIYREAFNNAYNALKQPDDDKSEVGRHDSAARTAWETVKADYHKGADGKWHPKTRRAF